MPLHLRNPHSVLAAIRSRPKDVGEVRVNSRNPQGAWAEVVDLARENRISVVQAMGGGDARRRQRSGGDDGGGRVGAGEAIVKSHGGISLEELFRNGQQRAGGKGLWIACDCLQDPHNIGAIFRSAAFFGVQGIVLTKDRSAPLNSTVYDVASGGVDEVPFSMQTNLSRALEVAKSSGLWVLGSSEHAETDVAKIDRERPWLLVLGNEQTGLRRRTLENCDETCRLSPRGRVTSLNVSVAAGILISTLVSD